MPTARCSGIYRKMHIPDDPLYYEKYYFTPGDLGFRVFTTRFGRVGTLVCWDQWYPEAARLTALQGADVLVYPTAIGWHPSEKAEFGAAQHDAWETIQRSHAIANGVFVAAVNRVGHEGRRRRAASSSGAARSSPIPSGVLLAKASHDREEILIVECDPGKSEAGPPQLAVLARPPHRRLRRIDTTLARVAPKAPAALGFRQPAEWEPHRATWLGWPHHEADWPGKLAAIVWVYAEIIRKLAQHEQVSLLVANETRETFAREVLQKAQVDLTRVEFVRAATDRAWMRDSAPSFVTSGSEVGVVDWEFNGWAKYPNFKRDNRVPAHIAGHRAMKRWAPRTQGGRRGDPRGGARRGEHRSRRRGDHAHHRGVPAERRSAAQPRRLARRARVAFCRLSGRPQGALAGPRHRWR